ncbi:hypothetical protein Slin14017_G122890 [Septoria linicola]|nr:hypothetical protein Slin14017_G122890 [Septoria linicola]
MKWFRNNSAGLPVQQTASSPSQQPSESAQTQLPATTAPRLGDDDEIEMLEAPARGVKRSTEDDMMDIDEEDSDFEYNSSGVCPQDGARHNQRVTKRPPHEHLLHLPQPVQQLICSYVLVSDSPYDVQPDGMMVPKRVIYWKVREDRSLTKKELKKHNGTPICKPPGLLTVSKQVREMALPIFYVGNDFDVMVSDYNGKAIMAWWKRVQKERLRAAEHPIQLAGSKARLDLHHTHAAGFRDLSQAFRQDEHSFVLHRLNDTRQSDLQLGRVEIDVDGGTNWNNLTTWLDLCHKGQLPPFVSSPYTDTDGHDLFGEEDAVSHLFDIAKLYPRGESAALHMCVNTHREHLICYNQDWAPDAEKTSDQQDSPSSSHTLDNETQYYNTVEPLGTDFTDPKFWFGDEDEETEVEEQPNEVGRQEAEEEEEEEDERLSSVQEMSHSEDTPAVVEIEDSSADEMELDDGHRHKRRKTKSHKSRLVVNDSDLESE